MNNNGNKSCSDCGFDHDRSPPSPRNNNSGGSGDAGSSPPPRKSGCGSGRRSPSRRSPVRGDNRGNGSPSGIPGRMNVDDDKVCPSAFYDNLGAYVCFAVVVCLILVWSCGGTPSFDECLLQGPNCKLNTNLHTYLEGKTTKGSCPKSQIPAHLRADYDAFRKALSDENCFIHDESDCPGLVNYAGKSAGAHIVTTWDTETLQKCKCQDTGKVGYICDPSFEAECSDCQCALSEAETIIKDDAIIALGQNWIFNGIGKIVVGLYYPVIVTGVSISHPLKARLPPGHFKSAPKDFEVWGYNSSNETDQHLFGRFSFGKKNLLTEVFAVKNFTLKEYQQIQFNFLTNHGHKHFTAVYRVKVHGLYDRVGKSD